MSIKSSIYSVVPEKVRSVARMRKFMERGKKFARQWTARDTPAAQVNGAAAQDDPLEAYFNAHIDGPGIWKWRHYFEIYHRHLAKFIDRPVNIVEIGIYSGGSLGMWRNYFGPGSMIHGVDIEPACRQYEGDGVKVWIGDQADRSFWARFKAEVAPVDIVIDDGGHMWEQQIVTLEELLPHVKAGGVYICEDVHGDSQFATYVSGMAANLNSHDARAATGEPAGSLASPVTPFQAAVHSIHQYPFMVVIERMVRPPGDFVASKHGTQWQPFAI